MDLAAAQLRTLREKNWPIDLDPQQWGWATRDYRERYWGRFGDNGPLPFDALTIAWSNWSTVLWWHRDWMNGKGPRNRTVMVLVLKSEGTNASVIIDDEDGVPMVEIEACY